tara:strand:- start:3975 stop:4334 length:360 start_codon:yes stop_codon:yes gene_type:complete
MRKLLYILIFALIGKTFVYASFPTVESNPFTQIESAYEEDKKLTKKQKLAWILAGLVGGIVGIVIALISQLVYKKKKGQFKFALLGYAAFLILSVLIDFFVSGRVPFGLDEIGDIFILG